MSNKNKKRKKKSKNKKNKSQKSQLTNFRLNVFKKLKVKNDSHSNILNVHRSLIGLDGLIICFELCR